MANVMLVLANVAIPVMIGFFAGMLWMRACYRDELRAAKRYNRKLERRLAQVQRCM